MNLIRSCLGLVVVLVRLLTPELLLGFAYIYVIHSIFTSLFISEMHVSKLKLD
jgi:hypothetical protein